MLQRLTLVDSLYLFYLGAIAGLAAWSGHAAAKVLLGHSAIALVIVFLAANCTRSPVLRFLHDWYPLAMFIFTFEEISHFSLAVVPHWQDFRILAFETRLFTVSPNVWLEQFGSRVLSELMDLGYFSYYPLFPVVAGVLYARGDKQHFHRLMLASVIMYLTVFAIYVAFPTRAPRHGMYNLSAPPHGFLFSWLVNEIQAGAGVRGNALPSSHVALAVLCALAARASAARLAPYVAVSVVLICAASVYGGYHYVSDVLAGILVALTSAALASLIVGPSCRLKEAIRE